MCVFDSKILPYKKSPYCGRKFVLLSKFFSSMCLLCVLSDTELLVLQLRGGLIPMGCFSASCVGVKALFQYSQWATLKKFEGVEAICRIWFENTSDMVPFLVTSSFLHLLTSLSCYFHFVF